MPDEAALDALYDDAYGNASEGYFAKAARKLKRGRRLAAKLRRRAAGNQFLDIGCNGGFMVEAARENGFQATGIDLDSVSIDYAQNAFPQNQFMRCRLEDLPSDQLFDVVYCSEVIEHVPDVKAFASQIADVTAPGGLLYLTTPDISHWRRPKDVTHWDAFCPPAHCLYFDPRSIARLLQSVGFVSIQQRFALKPGIRLYARKPDAPLDG